MRARTGGKITFLGVTVAVTIQEGTTKQLDFFTCFLNKVTDVFLDKS